MYCTRVSTFYPRLQEPCSGLYLFILSFFSWNLMVIIEFVLWCWLSPSNCFNTSYLFNKSYLVRWNVYIVPLTVSVSGMSYSIEILHFPEIQKNTTLPRNLPAHCTKLAARAPPTGSSTRCWWRLKDSRARGGHPDQTTAARHRPGERELGLVSFTPPVSFALLVIKMSGFKMCELVTAAQLSERETRGVPSCPTVSVSSPLPTEADMSLPMRQRLSFDSRRTGGFPANWTCPSISVISVQ